MIYIFCLKNPTNETNPNIIIVIYRANKTLLLVYNSKLIFIILINKHNNTTIKNIKYEK